MDIFDDYSHWSVGHFLCADMNYHNYNTPKADWGIEIWLHGLLQTGSKTLSKVGRPYGCAGCTCLQPRSVRMGT